LQLPKDHREFHEYDQREQVPRLSREGFEGFQGVENEYKTIVHEEVGEEIRIQTRSLLSE
jgi:hypothetical protein